MRVDVAPVDDLVLVLELALQALDLRHGVVQPLLEANLQEHGIKGENEMGSKKGTKMGKHRSRPHLSTI